MSARLREHPPQMLKVICFIVQARGGSRFQFPRDAELQLVIK